METFEQQRRPEIGSFARTLADASLDCGAIDLLDALWLAQFMETQAVVPQPAEQLQSQEQQAQEQTPISSVIEQDTTTTPGVNLYVDEGRPETKPSTLKDKEVNSEELADQPPNRPFSVPAAPALRTRLDLARSLRPLMRRVPSRTRFDLDEEATVTQIAETGVWMPTLQPRAERWLELDLVVEDSKTTVIWERAIAELKHLAEYQGAFRAVRTWRLSDQAGRLQLFSRWRDQFTSGTSSETVVSRRPHSPGELLDPTGRRLIWLVTDCTSGLWRQDELYQTLLGWTKVQPIAIVQMFPQRLWSRTALRNGHIIRLRSATTGIGGQLEIEGLPARLAKRSSDDLVTVPIVTIEAPSMLAWSRVVAGRGDGYTPGRTFDRVLIQKQSTQLTDRADSAIGQPTAQERVALFRATASKTARQLANLMAAAPVSLPVIDLLRDAFRQDFATEVHQSDVAEVLLSGLCRRCDSDEDGICRYEFWGDDSTERVDRVRDILLGDASIAKTMAVLNKLSAVISGNLNSPVQSFQALLDELISTEDSELRADAFPFARLGLDVLHRLGGEYAALARHYESEFAADKRQKQQDDDGAKFVDLPLQKCKYESATINAILDRFDFETAQIKRRSLLLGLRSKWEIDRRNASAWGYTEILTDEAAKEVGLDMIAVPGGSFKMGDELAGQGSQHDVTLQPFYLGRYPITQAQWRVVASYELINRKLDPNPSVFKTGDDLPVERIRWADAQEFCQRLSAKTGKTYRLPSEAEWEYACRAGTTTPFHFGETISPELANYNGTKTYNDGPKGEYRKQTTAVGSFPGNEWGLHDMHGNVWEWCEDDWHSASITAPSDGSAWVKAERSNIGNVLRGGAWSYFPYSCRSAVRYYGYESRNYVGFRVVCEPPRILLSS